MHLFMVKSTVNRTLSSCSKVKATTTTASDANSAQSAGTPRGRMTWQRRHNHVCLRPTFFSLLPVHHKEHMPHILGHCWITCTLSCFLNAIRTDTCKENDLLVIITPPKMNFGAIFWLPFYWYVFNVILLFEIGSWLWPKVFSSMRSVIIKSILFGFCILFK